MKLEANPEKGPPETVFKESRICFQQDKRHTIGVIKQTLGYKQKDAPSSSFADAGVVLHSKSRKSADTEPRCCVRRSVIDVATSADDECRFIMMLCCSNTIKMVQ